MILDKDLLSIQEARELSRKAYEAQLEFKHFSQQQVDKIVKAMVDQPDQVSVNIKNQFSTKNVYESLKDLKTVGIVGEEANGKVLKIAVPMGVVAALIPSTNPTSTAMFKTMISC